MPPGLISVSALICEKILSEQDGVVSAIRMVDVFTFTLIPELSLEKQPVTMNLLVHVSVSDGTEHNIALTLVRPSGATDSLGEVFRGVVPPSKVDGAPTGLTINAGFGVIPKQHGTYYVAVAFDGEEVTRLPFTLQERKVE